MGRSIEDACQTEEGWDGHYAAATSDVAREVALAADWVPTVNGGLQWEFHRDGWEIEIEISGTGRVSVFMEKRADG